MKTQHEAKMSAKPESQRMAKDGGNNVCEEKLALQAGSINPLTGVFVFLSKIQRNPLI